MRKAINVPLETAKLYSLQEVAKLLRVSERSVFRYINSGRLRATKIGYWRISGNDIASFLMGGIFSKDIIPIAKKRTKNNH